MGYAAITFFEWCILPGKRLTLSHSEQPKLHIVLAVLSATGLRNFKISKEQLLFLTNMFTFPASLSVVIKSKAIITITQKSCQ